MVSMSKFLGVLFEKTVASNENMASALKKILALKGDNLKDGLAQHIARQALKEYGALDEG